MRGRALVALVMVVAAIAACGGDSTGPGDDGAQLPKPGVWVLETVDGQALPVDEYGDGRAYIVDGWLELYPGPASTLRMESVTIDSTPAASIPIWYDWSCNGLLGLGLEPGDKLWLNEGCGAGQHAALQDSATVAGDVMTVRKANTLTHVWTYRWMSDSMTADGVYQWRYDHRH